MRLPEASRNPLSILSGIKRFLCHPPGGQGCCCQPECDARWNAPHTGRGDVATFKCGYPKRQRHAGFLFSFRDGCLGKKSITFSACLFKLSNYLTGWISKSILKTSFCGKKDHLVVARLPHFAISQKWKSLPVVSCPSSGTGDPHMLPMKMSPFGCSD